MRNTINGERQRINPNPCTEGPGFAQAFRELSQGMYRALTLLGDDGVTGRVVDLEEEAGMVRVNPGDDPDFLEDQFFQGGFNAAEDLVVLTETEDDGGDDKLRQFVDMSALPGYDSGELQSLTLQDGTLTLATLTAPTLWRWDGAAWIPIFSWLRPGYSRIEPSAAGSTVGEVQATENRIVTPWHYPDFAGSFGASGTAWQDVDNIKAPGGYATLQRTAAPDVVHNLQARDFGFEIPSGATIHGIEFEVGRKCDTGGTAADTLVYAISGGTNGDDRSDPSFWAASDEVIRYGGSDDLHGQSWSPGQVNAGTSTGFGLVLNTDSTLTVIRSVDFVRARIFYTL